MHSSDSSGFDVIGSFLNLAGLGAEWVMWLLVAQAVVLCALVLERLRLYSTTRIDTPALGRALVDRLERGQLAQAQALFERGAAMEERVLADALSVFGRGHRVVEHVMHSSLERERQRFERFLGYMGTLGNNAPFVGLLGTVIGIILAFQDLAANPKGGMAVVGPGIAEALVATAVGLLVAIPAVIAFNSFRGVVDTRLGNTELLGRIVLSQLSVNGGADAPAAED